MTVRTHSDIRHDLAALGVAPGDGLFVHASLGAIGTVLGGARTVVAALIEAVGPDGLVAMPAFSVDAYPAAVQLGRDLDAAEAARLDAAVPGFDPARSPTAGMGVIAETFRTWPGTRRSDHPTVSVCARGPDAEARLARHARVFACGPGTPLHALAARPRMKLLLLGVGWNRASALHTSETLAAHRRLKTRRCLDAQDGRPAWREDPEVADDLGRLFPDAGAAFEATGACRRGTVGLAETRLCGYAELVRFGAAWIDAANERSGDRA